MIRKLIQQGYQRPKFTQQIYRNFSKKAQETATKATKQNLKSEIKELIYLVKPEWRGFLMAAFFHGVASGILMYLPKVIPEFGNLYESKKEKIDKEKDDEQEIQRKQEVNKEIDNKYKKFILYWGGLCILSGVFTFGRRFFSMDLGNRIQFRLRNRLYTNLIQRDTDFFFRKNVSTANFVHKLSNDVSNIGNSLSMDLFFGFRSVFFVLGGSAFMIIKSQELILPCLVIMAGMTMSTKFIGGYQRKFKMEETQFLTKTSELAHERLSNIKLIKISNTEKHEKYLYHHTLSEYYDKSKLVTHYTALNFSVLEGFGFASLIGLFTYGSYLVTIGVSSPEMVSSAIYAFYVGMGFRGILNCYTELAKTAGLYSGIKELIGDIQNDPVYNEPGLIIERQKLLAEQYKHLNEDSKNQHNKKIQYDNINAPEIKIENLTFQYKEQNTEKVLFDNLNLTIQKGKIYAIVGPSGCGKTSLLNLITRLYKPNQGKILIDGEDISTFDVDWVQQNISYVTQEPIIFQGSILENLQYGNQGFDISFENIKKACDIANATQFIENLPEKYDTILTERGQSLSGGQRQRIVLARALVKNPKILIMDEGTANLDQESEKAIIRDLKEICQDRTCILITHKIENYIDIIDEIVTLKGQQKQEEGEEEENEQQQQNEK